MNQRRKEAARKRQLEFGHKHVGPAPPGTPRRAPPQAHGNSPPGKVHRSAAPSPGPLLAAVMPPQPPVTRSVSGISAPAVETEDGADFDSVSESSYDESGSDADNDRAARELLENLTAQRVSPSVPDKVKYREYLGTLVKVAVDKKLQQKLLYPLSGKSQKAFSKLVVKARAKKNPGQVDTDHSGRPKHFEDEDLARLLHKTLVFKERRDMKVAGMTGDTANFEDAVRRIIDASLARRGHKKLPPTWTLSTKLKRQLWNEAGIGLRSAGTDNSARAQAGASPRNVMTNFASIYALSQPEYTFDRKTVHRQFRWNFDAVTIYDEVSHGKVYTVAKRTPLLDVNPELDAMYERLKSLPNTTRNDGHLSQVLHNTNT